MSVLNIAEGSAELVLSAVPRWIHFHSYADVDAIAAIVEAVTSAQE